jgi:hypothetical protein
VTNASLIAGLADTFRGYGADPDIAARIAEAVPRDPDTARRGKGDLRLWVAGQAGADGESCSSPRT